MLKVELTKLFVIPHQDKSNFDKRPQYGSNEVNIE